MAMNLLIALSMLVTGIALFTGKATKYLKSYQNLDEKEKNNIRIGALCKNISLLFFMAALIFGLAGLSEAFRLVYFKWVIIGWFALGAADVIYIGKSSRFVNNRATTSNTSKAKHTKMADSRILPIFSRR